MNQNYPFLPGDFKKTKCCWHERFLFVRPWNSYDAYLSWALADPTASHPRSQHPGTILAGELWRRCMITTLQADFWRIFEEWMTSHPRMSHWRMDIGFVLHGYKMLQNVIKFSWYYWVHRCVSRNLYEPEESSDLQKLADGVGQCPLNLGCFGATENGRYKHAMFSRNVESSPWESSNHPQGDVGEWHLMTRIEVPDTTTTIT